MATQATTRKATAVIANQERFEMMIVSLWAVVVVAVYRTIQGNASTTGASGVGCK